MGRSSRPHIFVNPGSGDKADLFPVSADGLKGAIEAFLDRPNVLAIHLSDELEVPKRPMILIYRRKDGTFHVFVQGTTLPGKKRPRRVGSDLAMPVLRGQYKRR